MQESEQELRENGFEKRKDNICGSLFTYYRRIAVQFLGSQVLIIDNNDINKKHDPYCRNNNAVDLLMVPADTPVMKGNIKKHPS